MSPPVSRVVPGQGGQVLRQIVQVPTDGLHLPAVLTGQEKGDGNADHQEKKAGDQDRPLVLVDLILIPDGVEIRGDHAGHLPGGIEHGAEGAVEAAPFVFIGLLVYGGDSLAGGEESVRIDHGGAEFPRGHGVRVDAEGEGPVPHIPDIVDVVQADVVQETGEGLIDRLILRRSLVLRRQPVQNVAVQHGRRRVDHVQHALVDLRFRGDARLPHQHGAQGDVRRKDEKRHQQDHFGSQLHLFPGHSQFLPHSPSPSQDHPSGFS